LTGLPDVRVREVISPLKLYTPTKFWPGLKTSNWLKRTWTPVFTAWLPATQVRDMAVW
jgi:hypothetical protein